jgi:hypothetical protein
MQIKTTKKILTCPIVKNKKRMMTYSDVKLWENMHSPCWWAREGNFGWCTTKLSIPLFFDAAIPFLELYSEATPSSYKNTT